MDTKTCTLCKNHLPLTEFYFANKKRTVLASRCKRCANEVAAKRNATDPNRWLIVLKNKLNCNKSQVAQMLEDQDHKCAICGREGGSRKLHLDHDHSTGAIRQFLCNNCNHGIGCFGDNVELMLKAIAYIQKHKENQNGTHLLSK